MIMAMDVERCVPINWVVIGKGVGATKEDDGFDRRAVLKMYPARWGVEALFRELKSLLDVEPPHGHTVTFCEQEIAGSLIWMALAAYLEG